MILICGNNWLLYEVLIVEVDLVLRKKKNDLVVFKRDMYVGYRILNDE